MIRKALSLNPIPPIRYLYQLGYAYQNSGQFEEAVATHKKALKLNPDFIFAYLGLAVCYIMLQREEDARAAAAEVLKINPKFSVTQWEILLPFKNKETKRRELEALRKAGLK